MENNKFNKEELEYIKKLIEEDGNDRNSEFFINLNFKIEQMLDDLDNKCECGYCSGNW